jgi:hypothetical protein
MILAHPVDLVSGLLLGISLGESMRVLFRWIVRVPSR